MIHFNMDPKTIQHGGRKAPVITTDELDLLLKAAVPCDPEDGGGFGDPSSIDNLLYEEPLERYGINEDALREEV